MRRSTFNDIWFRVAKKRDWEEPTDEGLDIYWSCMGVLGRYGCPEKFEEAMMEEDSVFADCLIFEVEGILN